MKLSKPQRTISDCSARFRVAVCGRRFGKSFLAMNEVAKVARFPNKKIYLVYPSYRQAKTVMWDQIKYRMQDVGWLKKANETDLTITLINNSRISLRGADNPDSLRGVGLDFVCMDEFAMIDEKAWTEVLRPTLSDKAGSALFISTPLGTSNWAYDLYNRGLDPNEPNWASFSYSTLEGGNVPADEIEQARRDLDERTFEQEYLATFVTYRNRIYYAFDRAHNVRKYDGPEPKIIYIGMDFNINPMSIAVFVQEGDRVYAIDEIEMYSSNTEEAVEEIRARYPTAKVFVYPDPAGAARKTSAAHGQTDHTILANAGFVVKSPRGHNAVRDGINAVNSKLCNSLGQRTLFVDPKCRKIIECLEKHSFKEGTSIPDKDTGYDHMADAVRYYIDYAFPVRRDREEQPYPQRWGHAIGSR